MGCREEKFQNKISDYVQKDLISIVVNFVDLLAHKSAKRHFKELVPDESGYRMAVLSWLEQSWLFEVLKYLGNKGWTIIMTSDHGSIRVKNSVMVAADKGASSGLRYKFGRNLNTNQKNALIIKDPENINFLLLGINLFLSLRMIIILFIPMKHQNIK